LLSALILERLQQCGLLPVFAPSVKEIAKQLKSTHYSGHTQIVSVKAPSPDTAEMRGAVSSVHKTP